jgi:hypothetical protein
MVNSPVVARRRHHGPHRPLVGAPPVWPDPLSGLLMPSHGPCQGRLAKVANLARVAIRRNLQNVPNMRFVCFRDILAREAELADNERVRGVWRGVDRRVLISKFVSITASKTGSKCRSRRRTLTSAGCLPRSHAGRSPNCGSRWRNPTDGRSWSSGGGHGPTTPPRGGPCARSPGDCPKHTIWPQSSSGLPRTTWGPSPRPNRRPRSSPPARRS